MGTESTTDLISDPKNFLDALKRMWPAHSLTFANADETVEYLLRPDADSEDFMVTSEKTEMNFELLVVYDSDHDDDGDFRRLLAREFLVNEDDEFVVEEFTVEKTADAESFDLRYMMSALNRYYKHRICPCSRYLIKDSSPLCIFCHMTASESDMKLETCMICHDESPRITMEPRPCCKHLMHKHCINRWCRSEASGEEPTCPTCRAPIK